MCESCFATLECELLDRVSLRTPAEARLVVFDFIEGWYNTQRRHSSLAYESPVNSNDATFTARRRLWKVTTLWTPCGRPQASWKTRWARFPHLPQDHLNHRRS